MTSTKRKLKHTRHQPTGQWIRSDKRLAIYLRDEFTCLLCLKNLHKADPREISLDHVVPRSRWGTNASSNLYTACHQCNSLRADRPLTHVASILAVKRIRRNRRRKLAPYLKLARELRASNEAAP